MFQFTFTSPYKVQNIKQLKENLGKKGVDLEWYKQWTAITYAMGLRNMEVLWGQVTTQEMKDVPLLFLTVGQHKSLSFEAYI